MKLLLRIPGLVAAIARSRPFRFPVRHQAVAAAVFLLATVPAVRAETLDLENESLKLSFDVRAGGRCTGFAVKNAKAPLALQPGAEFMREIFDPDQVEKPAEPIAFTAEPMKDPKRGEGLLFKAVLTEKNSSRDVADMTLERRVWFPPGRRHVEVEELLLNKTPDVMGARMGAVHRFLMDSQKDSNAYYLPTERTVLQVVANSIARFYTWAPWDYSPVESWLGATNPKSPWSLAFILDPKYLDAFYAATAGSATGWLVDGGIIEPGAEFRTSYAIIPVQGFKGFAHASRRLLANVEVSSEGGGLALVHTLAGGVEPLGDVTLDTVLIGARTKQESRLGMLEFAKVGLEGVSQKAAWPKPQTEPVVIKMVARGKGWEEAYEAYYEGKFTATVYPGYPWMPEYRRKRLP